MYAAVILVVSDCMSTNKSKMLCIPILGQNVAVLIQFCWQYPSLMFNIQILYRMPDSDCECLGSVVLIFIVQLKEYCHLFLLFAWLATFGHSKTVKFFVSIFKSL